MYVPAIDNIFNPFYFLWVRKKNDDIIWFSEKSETFFLTIPNNKELKLQSGKKYQLKIHSNLTYPAKISIFDQHDRNITRLVPLVEVNPNEDKVTSIFMLTKGNFKILDIPKNRCSIKITVK